MHHVPGKPTSWQGGLELDLEEKKIFAEMERKLDLYFNVNIHSESEKVKTLSKEECLFKENSLILFPFPYVPHKHFEI